VTQPNDNEEMPTMNSTRHHPIARRLVTSALAALLLNPIAASAVRADSVDERCHKKESPPGVCPLPGLDRCSLSNPFDPQRTAFGNGACDMLRDVNGALGRLGKDADRERSRAEEELRALVRVTLDGVIDEQAVASFVHVRDAAGAVIADFKALADHPKCGVKGTLRATAQSLRTSGQQLAALAGVAGKAGEAAAPALENVPKLASLSAELGQLVSELEQGGPRPPDAAQLEVSLGSLRARADQLGALDVAGTVAAGLKLGATVGPFVAECAACTTLLADAIGSVGASAGGLGAGGGTCPASAGAGCAVGFAVGALGGINSVALGAVSALPCQGATSKLAQLDEYVANAQAFATGVVALAANLEQELGDVERARSTLAKLSGALPTALGPRAVRIDGLLQEIGQNLNRSADILEREVSPRLSALGESFLRGLSRGTEDMQYCFAKLGEAAELAGDDGREGFDALVRASASLIDGGALLTTLRERGQKAIDGASKEALRRWGAANQSAIALHRSLFGVSFGDVDVLKTAATMGGIITNEARFNDTRRDVAELAGAMASLIPGAVEAGKNAYLDRDKLMTQGKARYVAAASDAHKATVALAKARARANARRPSEPSGKPVPTLPRVPAQLPRVKLVSALGARLR